MSWQAKTFRPVAATDRDGSGVGVRGEKKSPLEEAAKLWMDVRIEDLLAD